MTYHMRRHKNMCADIHINYPIPHSHTTTHACCINARAQEKLEAMEIDFADLTAKDVLVPSPLSPHFALITHLSHLITRQ